jgi:hypothetical protein
MRPKIRVDTRCRAAGPCNTRVKPTPTDPQAKATGRPIPSNKNSDPNIKMVISSILNSISFISLSHQFNSIGNPVLNVMNIPPFAPVEKCDKTSRASCARFMPSLSQ